MGMGDAHTEHEHGRRETPAERVDRKFVEQLQELRVMQTGTQLIAGFLLTLPFQQRFTGLTRLQEVVYLSLVVLAGVATLLVLSSVAVHRKLTGQHIKDRVVEATHRAMAAALVCVGLLITGMTFFIFDVVLGRTEALVAAAAMAVVALSLLLAVPQRLQEK